MRVDDLKNDQATSKLVRKNSKFLDDIKDPKVRAETQTFCQTYGLMRLKRGSENELKRFLSLVFLAYLKKINVKTNDGRFYPRCPRDLLMFPVEWFASRNVVMDGWPVGLSREPEGSWSVRESLALARLFIERKIRLLKIGSTGRIIEDLTLSDREIEKELENSRRNLTSTVKTRMVIKDGGDHSENEANDISITETSRTNELTAKVLHWAKEDMTEKNSKEFAMCQDPAIYAANIKICRNFGFKNGNTKKGHEEIKKFVSQAILVLFQAACIYSLEGKPYTRQCPNGFNTNPQLWLQGRGCKAVGWPLGTPPIKVLYWPIHMTFSFATMLLRGEIRFEAMGPVVSSITKERTVVLMKEAAQAIMGSGSPVGLGRGSRDPITTMTAEEIKQIALSRIGGKANIDYLDGAQIASRHQEIDHPSPSTSSSSSESDDEDEEDIMGSELEDCEIREPNLKRPDMEYYMKVHSASRARSSESRQLSSQERQPNPTSKLGRAKVVHNFERSNQHSPSSRSQKIQKDAPGRQVLSSNTSRSSRPDDRRVSKSREERLAKASRAPLGYRPSPIKTTNDDNRRIPFEKKIQNFSANGHNPSNFQRKALLPGAPKANINTAYQFESKTTNGLRSIKANSLKAMNTTTEKSRVLLEKGAAGQRNGRTVYIQHSRKRNRRLEGSVVSKSHSTHSRFVPENYANKGTRLSGATFGNFRRIMERKRMDAAPLFPLPDGLTWFGTLEIRH
ncbi:hypothetical protein SCHPADRAFT_904062 [Schizopora paradoxa]|uniref:Uncharacterized protein n=1 Tax=Schizopora paradoxa TaxID=27342 RepID=A0A0H2RVZ4_9AGAM|nr:hypothetical protein SCHPADRAFT_904062 [Schizopora paradoxa]